MKLFIHQFTNPLVLLLVIAVVLSSILGETTDTLIILGILPVTGFIGVLAGVKCGRVTRDAEKLFERRCIYEES